MTRRRLFPLPVLIALGALLSSCAWFGRPGPPRPAPDPATVRRGELRAALARETDPGRRCLLHLHEAVLDLQEGASPQVLAHRLAGPCPSGRAAVFEAAAAHLAGDPWTAGEKALRFLENTAGESDPALAGLRMIAAILVPEAQLPDGAFLRRLEAVARRDPGLPVLLWADRPHLLRRIADPAATSQLGTGLTFSRAAAQPLLGRLHFERAVAATGVDGAWRDGEPLASGSAHPEAVDLSLQVTCTAPGPLLLELRPQGPALVLFEGLSARSSSRTPGVEDGLWRMSLPGFTGTRRLTVRLVASPRTAHPRIRLVPTSACGFGVDPAPAFSGTGQVPVWLDPLDRLANAGLLAVAGAAAEPRERLEGLLSRTPNLTLARSLLARAILSDASLLPETARTLALRQVASSPGQGWARIVEARLAEDEGHPEKALERLAPLRSDWASVARSRLARTGGGLEAIGPSPAELASSSRHHLVFLEAAADAGRGDPRAALALLRPALALRPDLPDLLRHHLRLQQFAEALAEGLRLEELGAVDAELHAQLAAACLGLRDLACALDHAQRRLALDPGSETAFLRLHDLRTASGHDAAAVFAGLAERVRRFPAHRDTLMLLWTDPAFRRPPLPDLPALLAMKWGEEAPAVFLLNREEHFLSPSGGAFVRVTRWVRLNTPVAVEELGELELPADALLLDVHTRKADGTEYPPSATPQKASFSLRNLEPGDTVAFSYLRVNPPIQGLPGRTWGRRFQLAHHAFPTVLAEWVLHAPAGVDLVLLPEGQVPRIERTEDADGVHLRLQAWTRDRLPTELRSARFVPPSIQVHAGFTVDDLHSLIAEEAPWPDWDSLELASLARRLCPARKPSCVPDTARWVLRHVRDDRQLTRASHALQRRTGSRAHLLFALLRHQGFAPRMVLARVARAGDGPDSWPDPTDYPIWLLEVPGFGFIDTRFSHLPPGDMVPALGGALAIGVGPGPATVRLGPAAPQRRRLEVRATLGADRGARLDVRETGSGFHAAQKLDQFRGLTPEALRERIQVDSLQRYFPGARLLTFAWRQPDPDRDGLAAEYSFSAPSVCAVGEGGSLELRRFPFPWNLRRRFQVLAPRTTDLQPVALPDTRLEMVLVPPPGMRVEPAPELRLETEFGRLVRRLEAGPDGTFRLIVEKSLKTDVVTLARWKAFTAFVQLFDEYEALPVVLVPANRGEP